MTRYVAMDIGCLECGEDSRLIGVYTTDADAEQACAVAEEEQKRDWHGQHAFEVFPFEDDELERLRVVAGEASPREILGLPND